MKRNRSLILSPCLLLGIALLFPLQLLGAETSAPQAEQPAAQAEQPAPQAEQPAPQAEQPAPQAEQPAPRQNSLPPRNSNLIALRPWNMRVIICPRR